MAAIRTLLAVSICHAVPLYDYSRPITANEIGLSTSPLDPPVALEHHAVLAASAEVRSLEVMENEFLLHWNADHHTRTRNHVTSLSAHDLSNYYHHASRTAVGPSFMVEFPTLDGATAECDAMGYICAGVSYDITTGKAEIVPRGYALRLDASYDFYRKKSEPERTQFESQSMKALPSDIYEWYALNETATELAARCAPDQRCAGYYMCSGNRNDADSNCAHLESPALGVLLRGVPAPSLLKTNAQSTIVSKVSAQTCDGTADGATCSFPFTSTGTGDEHYECTIADSARPWCYTTRPGRWGYCDCNGADPINMHWELGNWSACSRTCGTGLETREVACVNSTSGEVVDNIYLCGQLPETSRTCNTHSCTPGCDLPASERRTCTGYYQDTRSKMSSIVGQKNLCSSCTWTECSRVPSKPASLRPQSSRLLTDASADPALSQMDAAMLTSPTIRASSWVRLSATSRAAPPRVAAPRRCAAMARS